MKCRSHGHESTIQPYYVCPVCNQKWPTIGEARACRNSHEPGKGWRAVSTSGKWVVFQWNTGPYSMHSPEQALMEANRNDLIPIREKQLRDEEDHPPFIVGARGDPPTVYKKNRMDGKSTD